MKLKEYFSIYKELLKSKSLVILRCPYCNSFDITYYKNSLKEDNEEMDGFEEGRKIRYNISCNKCNSVSVISEYWGK